MDRNRKPMGKVPGMGEQNRIDAVPLDQPKVRIGVMLPVVRPQQYGNTGVPTDHVERWIRRLDDHDARNIGRNRSPVDGLDLEHIDPGSNHRRVEIPRRRRLRRTISEDNSHTGVAPWLRRPAFALIQRSVEEHTGSIWRRAEPKIHRGDSHNVTFPG